MGTTALCTIIAKNYLPAARALMQSVREHHPEFARFVLLVDEPEGYFAPEGEDFAVTLSTALDIPHSRLFHFKYNLLELSTAVKPYYLQALFDERDVDRILYLDPDILLYDCLTPVIDALRDHNIVLTPHLTGSLDDDHLPGEHEILKSGAYNLGFIGMRRSAETARFLRWWQRKLENDCISDVDRNLFVDQRWIDLVPGMFADVAILRDPSLNVAYWNLPHRRLEERDGRYSVNDEPLRFFHFSGFRADNHRTISHYQDRYSTDLPGPLRALVEDYRRRLLVGGFMACKEWPYAFSRFRDGSPIPDICRRIVRDDRSFQVLLAAVAEDEVPDAVLDYLNEPSESDDEDAVMLTRLAVEIRARRRDVHVAFPDLTGPHRYGFASWFVNEGARDYRLPRALVEPVATSLDAASLRPEVAAHLSGRPIVTVQHPALQAEMYALGRSRQTMGTAAAELREEYHRLIEWASTSFDPTAE